MADSSTLTDSHLNGAGVQEAQREAQVELEAVLEDGLSSPAEIDARRARQLLERSTALSARGDEAGAMLACRQAVALAPDSSAAHSQLAHLLERGGNIPDAISALEKVLVLAPGSASERESLRRLRNVSKKRAASPVFRFDDNELFGDASGSDTSGSDTANSDTATSDVVVASQALELEARPAPDSPSVAAAIPSASASAAAAASAVAVAAQKVPALASPTPDAQSPMSPAAQASTAGAPQAASLSASVPQGSAAPLEPVIVTAGTQANASALPVPAAPAVAATAAPPLVVTPARTDVGAREARQMLPAVHAPVAAFPVAVAPIAVAPIQVGPVMPLDFGETPTAPRSRMAPFKALSGHNSFYLRSAPLVATSVLGLAFMLWARDSALSRAAARGQNDIRTTVVESSIPDSMPSNGASTQTPATTTSANPIVAAPSSTGNPTTGSAPIVSSSSVTTTSGTSVAPTANGSIAAGARAKTNGGAATAGGASRGTTSGGNRNPAPRSNPFEGLTGGTLPPPASSVATASPDVRTGGSDGGGSTSGGGPLNPGAAGRRGAIRVIPGALQPPLPRSDNRANSAEEAARDAASRGQTASAIKQTTASINAGGADLAFRLQQRALLHVDQGDNARAIDDFRGAIAAYNDLISRGVRVAEARKGLAACQSGLRLAQFNQNR